MVRNILSVVSGVAAAVATLMAAEMINHKIHPGPDHSNMADPEVMGRYLSEVGLGFWLIVLLGYIIGSLLAGFIIQKISNTPKLILPLIAGALLTLSNIANVSMIKHPTWFVIVGTIVFIPGVLLGNKLAKSN